MATGLVLSTSTERFVPTPTPSLRDYRSPTMGTSTNRRTVESTASRSEGAAQIRQTNGQTKRESTEPVKTPRMHESQSRSEEKKMPVDSTSAPAENGVEATTKVSSVRQSDEPVDMFRFEANNLVVSFLHNFVVQIEQLPFPHANVTELNTAVAALLEHNRLPSQIEQAMIATANIMNAEQGSMFKQLVSRIPIDANLPQGFSGIAEQVFIEPTGGRGFTWSRLVALFLFTGRVTAQCIKMEAGGLVWPVALNLVQLIVTRLRSEIERLGGWSAFVEYANMVGQSQAAPQRDSRLRRLWSHVINVTRLGGDESTSTPPSADGQLSPGALAKTAWFAPLAIGAGALLTAIVTR